MITVTLQRCPSGYIRRFTATGHSGYGEQGADIICAAVSAIAQTTIGSLQDLAGLSPDFALEDGHIWCQTSDPDDMAPEQYKIARTLTDSFALGCLQIQQSYGKKYVSVKEAIFT
ncbi:MAG TPA: ribosomal-processing cysteine protease Prp [Clostridiales bacterium]|nr:ribosomal-processing cysteine protease Prp [Clostridiales bacterium]